VYGAEGADLDVHRHAHNVHLEIEYILCKGPSTACLASHACMTGEKFSSLLALALTLNPKYDLSETRENNTDNVVVCN